MDFDKIDVEILYSMFYREISSPMKAFTIKEIMNNSQLGLSYHSVYRRASKLKTLDYLKDGLAVGNVKTFYLTDKSIEYIKSVIVKQESVFDIEELYEESSTVQLKMENNYNNKEEIENE